MKNRLCVIVLVKNESTNIAQCLKSAMGADELLVIDDFSNDDTESLAKENGARVVQHKLLDFSSQRNFALTQTACEWVFFLDADERFSPQLLKSIRQHIEKNADMAGSVLRQNFAFGERFRFGPLKADRVNRLFKRTMVKWVGNVHERAVFQGEAENLKPCLLHLTYHSWGQYLEKQYRYATVWAEEAASRGKQSTYFIAVVRSLAGFFKMFVLNLGFLGGPKTWAMSYFHGAYTLFKYLKLAEIQSPEGAVHNRNVLNLCSSRPESEFIASSVSSEGVTPKEPSSGR